MEPITREIAPQLQRRLEVLDRRLVEAGGALEIASLLEQHREVGKIDGERRAIPGHARVDPDVFLGCRDSLAHPAFLQLLVAEPMPTCAENARGKRQPMADVGACRRFSQKGATIFVNRFDQPRLRLIGLTQPLQVKVTQVVFGRCGHEIT